MRRVAPLLFIVAGCRIGYDPQGDDAGADATLRLDARLEVADARGDDAPGLDAGPDAPLIDAAMLDAPVIDAAMADAPSCVPTADEGLGAPDLCEDGADNDCDGLVDRSDPDCPRMRFRSVGIDGTALTGDTAVEIVGDRARFTPALPAGVGVGDVVVLASTALPVLAFVSERLSASELRVQAADGGAPAPAPPGTAAEVYRAYTSLAAWQAQDENPALPAGVRDFDRDRALVDARAALTVALYADGADHGNVIVSGWQTSPDHYLRFFTPVSATEVGVSQRHGGVVGRGYRFTADANLAGIQLLQSHVRIDGLVVVGFPGAGPTVAALEVIADAGDIDVRVGHNLVDGNLSTASNGALHLEARGATAAGLFRVSNNVVWNASLTSSECMWHRNDAGALADFLIFHNTVWNCARGIEARDTAGRAIAINNIAFVVSGGPAFYQYNGPGEYGARSTHNVSGDLSAGVLGTPVLVSADPATILVSLDPMGPDLHLRPDAPVLGMGLDLTTDPQLPVTDDIDGQPRRPGAIDPGADQL